MGAPKPTSVMAGSGGGPRTIAGASVDSVDHFQVGLIAVAPGVEPAGRRPQRVEEPGEELV